MKNLPPFIYLFLFLTCMFIGCSSNDPTDEIVLISPQPVVPEEEEEEQTEEPEEEFIGIYLGADLSYVNEMEDCGGIYLDEEGNEVEPFKFFSDRGANITRVRLWHTPDWTSYSGYEDVKKTIARAKQNGMEVLLDFHYSDTWADPGSQIMPSAWEEIESNEVMADSVYEYTYSTLEKLSEENLLPVIVQIGNEINREILQLEGNQSSSINWQRNVLLLNAGIKAVKDFSENIEVMLHIAQPENAIWWFKEAHQNGIGAYDWIGLSYYPIWSSYDMNQVPQAITNLKNDYNKRVMIVETAYPHTLTDVDNANNILGEQALIEGYGPTPEGQKKYIMDLVRNTTRGGAEGVIYWEPAWISTNCSTLWGQGSHWDNATFFSGESLKALPAFDFFDPAEY